MSLFARASTTALCGLFAVSPAIAAETPPLDFRIVEGDVLNAFYRQGPTAAHLLLSGGRHPRVLVAFPAGNSGVGLWFEDAATPLRWTLDGVRGADIQDARGRTLRGIVADARIDGTLVVHDAALGNVRTLRDYQFDRRLPDAAKTPLQARGDTLVWARSRLDGAPGYALSMDVIEGAIARDADGRWRLSPKRAGEPLRLRIAAYTGEPPLTPLEGDALLNANAGDDARSRQALAFLAYREKFLAGSWRFNTYFGRDTLMSLRLLMPALAPEAIESGLGAVLERLDAGGEVAHEEEIGEFAVLRRRDGTAAADAATPDRQDAAMFDYAMVDDDFMLAPVAAAYLLETPEGRARRRSSRAPCPRASAPVPRSPAMPPSSCAARRRSRDSRATTA